MNAAEHRAEAARLLDLLDGDFFNDAQWHQAVATRALAHATLAGLLEPVQVFPDSITLPPPWEHDEDIVFQGPAAAQRVECQRLAREEYTKRHAAELIAKLSEEH